VADFEEQSSLSRESSGLELERIECQGRRYLERIFYYVRVVQEGGRFIVWLERLKFNSFGLEIFGVLAVVVQTKTLDS
jgi:hypothetical protein